MAKAINWHAVRRFAARPRTRCSTTPRSTSGRITPRWPTSSRARRWPEWSSTSSELLGGRRYPRRPLASRPRAPASNQAARARRNPWFPREPPPCERRRARPCFRSRWWVGTGPDSMHLKSIRLRGFKSFPEAVEVRLEPGVAVVVGPNGSGKSNVADALLWAAGSAQPARAAGREARRRALRGLARPRRPTIARSSSSSTTRTGRCPSSSSRDLDRTSTAPRRRGPVPGQPRGGAEDRPGRAARGRRPRRRARLGDQPGQGRGDPWEQAGGAPGADRGRRRPGQVQAPPPPRGAEARAGAVQVERARDLEAEVQSGCARSRCRRPRPSAPRSCAGRSPACVPAWPSSTWRRSTSASARSRSDAPPRRSSASAPTSGSRRCWASATASRRSSPPPPGARGRDLRALPPPRAAPSGSSCGVRPRASSPSGSRGSRRAPVATDPEREAMLDQARLTRERLSRSSTRSPSARACPRRPGRSPRRESNWRSRCWRSRPATSAPSLRRWRRGRRCRAERRPLSGRRRARRGPWNWRARPDAARQAGRPPLEGRVARRPRRHARRRAVAALLAVVWLAESSGSRARCAPRHARGHSATTPSAASSGSQARRPRRSCSSSRPAVVRSREELEELERRTREQLPAEATGRRRSRRWSSLAERLAAALAGRSPQAVAALRGAAPRPRGRRRERSAASSAAELRRLGAEEAEAAARRRGGGRARGGDRRRARAPRGRGGRGAAPSRGGGAEPARGRRPRGARARSSSGSSGAARRSVRSTRLRRRSTSTRRSGSTELPTSAPISRRA